MSKTQLQIDLWHFFAASTLNLNPESKEPDSFGLPDCGVPHLAQNLFSAEI